MPIPRTLPTIVVLPLVDMSVDQSESALCDGLTEELSNWLAHIPTLRVVARTSAFAFKGQNIDVRKIAAELGATHVLEGSLRRSGDQLRITVQLIAADTGLHIWSRSFDRPIGDIFEIEDTVSRAVAEQLHLELTADTAELWAQRQPGTMEAHELYLLGRARQSRRTADDNLKSVEYFRRAVTSRSAIRAGAGRSVRVAAQRHVAESRAHRRREGRGGTADQPRHADQSGSARGARGEGLAAQRGIPLRRSPAAAAARDQAESERRLESSFPRRSLRPPARSPTRP